jgi:hypothetical protein
MTAHTWYRAVIDSPEYGGQNDSHFGPRFLTAVQARADAKRMSAKYDVDWTVAQCPVPDDHTEVL